jgi:hypothetical protein
MRRASYFLLSVLAMLLCLFLSMIVGRVLAGAIWMVTGWVLDPMYFIGFMTASCFWPLQNSIRLFFIEFWGRV